MPIPGIPPEDIERSHWYFGPGRCGGYAYRHLPSGITVRGVCPRGMKTLQLDQALFAEFVEKLKAAGIITDKEAGGEERTTVENT